METSITKFFKFEAAHNLPNYVGACRSVHGHSYKLEVEISGREMLHEFGSSTGMIIDFTIMKEIVTKEIIDQFDHKMLNDIFPNPTAEIMTRWIMKKLSESFNALGVGLEVERVRLWETDTSYCEVKK